MPIVKAFQQSERNPRNFQCARTDIHLFTDETAAGARKISQHRVHFSNVSCGKQEECLILMLQGRVSSQEQPQKQALPINCGR